MTEPINQFRERADEYRRRAARGPRARHHKTTAPAGAKGNGQTDMNFGEALTHLRAGRDVARKGWNGKGMWIGLGTQSAELSVPFLFIHAADGNQVPWTISQTDALADDWELTVGARSVPAPPPSPVHVAARAVIDAFATRDESRPLAEVLMDPLVALDDALEGRT